MKIKKENTECEVSLQERSSGAVVVRVQVPGGDPLDVVLLKEGRPITVGHPVMNEENTGIPTDPTGRPQVIDHRGKRFIPEDVLSKDKRSTR